MPVATSSRNFEEFVRGQAVPELAETLAGEGITGHVVAPAGFGKTHLIAQAVKYSKGRRLVLTHTYAGVNSLRRKLRDLNVPAALYRVDTIAGWALQRSLSYKATSGWTTERPEGGQWDSLYQCCSALLDHDFVKRIVRASYIGVFVDEYQDCTVDQHSLVLKLAGELPCCVLGDPLQGIFNFNGNAVDWERDVCSAFAPIGHLATPHRWLRSDMPLLGEWLLAVRQRLQNRDPIDLGEAVPHGVTIKTATPEELLRTQQTTCRYFTCAAGDTVIAIHKGSQAYKERSHTLARNVGGTFSSIEEIEGRSLFQAIKRIEGAATSQDKLLCVLSFAAQCMTAVREVLAAPTARGEHTVVKANTKHPEVVEAANNYMTAPTSLNVSQLLNTIKRVQGVDVVRGDLFNRMMGALRKHSLSPELTLTKAAEKYHTEFRHEGRPLSRKRLIGTTLLVKGLEFDHAIVLDASSLSRKELYVALTRGAKSLTIISSSSILSPAD